MVTLSPSLKSLFGSKQANETINATLAEKLKWIVFSLVLLFSLLVIDYFANQSNVQFVESDLLPELPTYNQLEYQGSGDTQVIDLYDQFDQPKVVEQDEVDESTVEIVDSMSLAEQNRQSGLLSKLYIGDAIYRLSGIVTSGQYQAALSISYTQVVTESGPELAEVNQDQLVQLRKTNISLLKGDNLGPYMVESVSGKRLTLVDKGRRLWLELFVPQLIKQQGVDGE